MTVWRKLFFVGLLTVFILGLYWKAACEIAKVCRKGIRSFLQSCREDACDVWEMFLGLFRPSGLR